MKSLHKLMTMMLLVTSISTIAQEYKFGKVSKEELLESSYVLDSSANAAILYENKKVSVKYNSSSGFELITEVFKRIKLYNKDGFEYASEEMLLYKSGSNSEIISGLKGVTYNISDDKIIKTKLKKEGIFKSEFSENYNQQKFTMPAIQEGSVIEYKYKMISPFLSTIDRIYLQREIPIKKLEVKVASPEYFNYKKFSTGYMPIDLKQSKYGDKITFTTKTRSGYKSSSTEFSRSAIDFTVNVDVVNSANIPAFIEEPYSGNVENYISSLSYELSFVKLPDSPIDYRSTTWEDVVKTIYQNSSFGDELKKPSILKKILINLLLV